MRTRSGRRNTVREEGKHDEPGNTPISVIPEVEEKNIRHTITPATSQSVAPMSSSAVPDAVIDEVDDIIGNTDDVSTACIQYIIYTYVVGKYAALC